MEDYRVRYQQWLEDPFIDEETKAELRGITDENEIKERFFKELEFGTGGLRGIIGNGSNRLNRYTVGKASQGLANYIKKEGTQKQGVAIAYDSRFMSPEFAEVAGLIFAANGILCVCISLSAPRSHAFLCGERAGLYGRGCADGKP